VITDHLKAEAETLPAAVPIQIAGVSVAGIGSKAGIRDTEAGIAKALVAGDVEDRKTLSVDREYPGEKVLGCKRIWIARVFPITRFELILMGLAGGLLYGD
jgi:hypothetical protein